MTSDEHLILTSSICQLIMDCALYCRTIYCVDDEVFNQRLVQLHSHDVLPCAVEWKGVIENNDTLPPFDKFIETMRNAMDATAIEAYGPERRGVDRMNALALTFGVHFNLIAPRPINWALMAFIDAARKPDKMNFRSLMYGAYGQTPTNAFFALNAKTLKKWLKGKTA